MAYEDWTGWTEVDADGDLTIAANQITISTEANTSSCVYKLYGTNYFSGEFTHKVDFQITGEAVDHSEMGIISYSDIAHWTYYDLSSGGVCIYGWCIVGTRTDAMYIEKSGSYDSLNYNLLENTIYYLKIVRNAANLITCYVYSDAARTTLLDSISITDTVAYDYLSCAWAGTGNGGTPSWSGLLYNLDVGGAGGNTYNESIALSSTPACSHSPQADLLGSLALASTPALSPAAIADLFGSIGLASTPAASMIGGMDYSAELALLSNPAFTVSAIADFYNSLSLASTPAAVMAAVADLIAGLALASDPAFAALGGSDFYESLALSSDPAFASAVFKEAFGELTLASSPALAAAAIADLYAIITMATSGGISLTALAEFFSSLSLSSTPAFSTVGQIGGTIIQKMVMESIGLREKLLRTKKQEADGDIDIRNLILTNPYDEISPVSTTWERTEKIQKDVQ